MCADLSKGESNFKIVIYTIRNTRCPIVFLKNNIITNEQECRWLQTDEVFEPMAMPHVDEIAVYLSEKYVIRP